MSAMIAIALDVILIALLAAAIIYAAKLSKQLATLRASRTDMERFVLNFNTSVNRAEASINGLKQAARSSGDDLEQLIEKSQKMMDEMTFLIESADQMASRLTQAATPSTSSVSEKGTTAHAAQTSAQQQKPIKKPVVKETKQATSSAEKDLIQALEKLG